MPKPDYAHKWTDKQLAALEKRIAAEFQQAAEELTDTVNAYFAAFVKRDAEMAAKAEAGEITEQAYKQWRLAQIGRGKRFEALRDKVAERYTNAHEVAIAYINDATPGIYTLNRNYAAYTIEQISDKADFTLWDEQTVRRLIEEQPKLMPYYPPKRALKRGIDLDYGKKQITASITSSILQGKGIDKISRDLQNRMQGMSLASAIRTARTATTAAQNAGRMDSYRAAEGMGIKLKKEWLATLDGRTRHAHAMLDGQTAETDKPFHVDGYEIMYPGDTSAPGYLVYNCRCTLIAALDGVDTSSGGRRARDPKTGEWVLVGGMHYAEWAGWKTNTGSIAKVEDIKGVNVNPKQILPVNEVTDKQKFAALVYDFEHSGYSGRPIVVVDMGNGEYQALSGSHRIFAARTAEIEIPTVIINYDTKTAQILEAHDDEERAAIAEKLHKNGSISDDAYRLLVYEDEANFAPVSAEYKAVVEKKAELYKAEKEAKAAAKKAADEAAKAAKEKEAEEFAKARAESPEMAEYKEFLDAMNKKYGDENIWSDMTDSEYDKLERLERIAYKGK